MTHNDQDAQDVVQEAYVKAFRFIDGFQGVDARAWLLSIVRNIGPLAIHAVIDDLRSGRLVRVFPEYHQRMLGVYARYVSRQFVDAKIRTFLDHLSMTFSLALGADERGLDSIPVQGSDACRPDFEGTIQAQYRTQHSSVHQSAVSVSLSSRRR
ncbi:sigma factor [Burkholderia pyrrocinia]|uniref:sigma factor n=1 Tax=Burkholderia pyrrocinia TaxID=60550 RepID=UPI0020C5E343|nr:sigma factor [Burkholderia pyrrocinia]